jgi:hypothetical protein
MRNSYIWSKKAHTIIPAEHVELAMKGLLAALGFTEAKEIAKAANRSVLHLRKQYSGKRSRK